MRRLPRAFGARLNLAALQGPWHDFQSHHLTLSAFGTLVLSVGTRAEVLANLQCGNLTLELASSVKKLAEFLQDWRR